MHILPASASPLRSMFSVEHDLVPIGTGQRLPATFRDALQGARDTMAASKAIRSVTVIALRANDDLVLVRVGPRGGHKCLWNFSRGTKCYR